MKQNLGLIAKDKKGAGLIQGLVMGVAGLVIGVIIAFVLVSTLNDASLLTSGSVEQNTTDNLIANFSSGVNKVAEKVPTVLLVAAVVLIFGALAAWYMMAAIILNELAGKELLKWGKPLLKKAK